VAGSVTVGALLVVTLAPGGTAPVDPSGPAARPFTSAAPPVESGALPSTGADIAALAPLGMAAICFGGVLLRRRRTAS